MISSGPNVGLRVGEKKAVVRCLTGHACGVEGPLQRGASVYKVLHFLNGLLEPYK